jgi:hypothetical protein
MPYCPPKGFWEDLLSDCTGGLILNHKRILIAEIRDKARARLDNFTELEFSDIVTTISLVSREELSKQKGNGGLPVFRSDREFAFHAGW